MGHAHVDTRQRRRSVRLGAILPLLILLVFLTDGTLRFLPREWFTFRAWEALKLQRAPEAAFLPGRYYRNELVYGDLAALGNLPARRQYREETFSTDQYGYRNLSRDWSSSPPDAILLGSSFSVGPGMRDDETLSAQLSAATGRSVYNAAGFADEATLGRLRSIAARLGFQRGIVVVEYLERFDPPSLAPPAALPAGCGPGYSRSCGPAESLVFSSLAALQVSPLQVLTERALKGLEDDRLLPNPYASKVVQARLVNGETMLFLPEEVERYDQLQADSGAAIDRAAQYFSDLRQILASDGTQLIVLLVPNKYNVYRPLLARSDVTRAETPLYLTLLGSRLNDLGVPAVNLLPLFREQAAATLADDEYIYWRDDTHWNPNGIHLAAQQLARVWPR
jgi:hypothetical protein